MERNPSHGAVINDEPAFVITLLIYEDDPEAVLHDIDRVCHAYGSTFPFLERYDRGRHGG